MNAFFVKIDCFLCEILIGSSPYPINKRPSQTGTLANKMKIIWKHWKSHSGTKVYISFLNFFEWDNLFVGLFQNVCKRKVKGYKFRIFVIVNINELFPLF